MTTLRVGASVRAGGVILIPIERVHTCAESLDAEGNAWTMDELVRRLPELGTLIDRLAPRWS